jgi:hypothetical protein
MRIKVNSVVIDFSSEVCDCPPNMNYQDNVIQSVLNRIWIFESEDEIVEEISDEIGWCIYSIDYEILPETQQ